MPKRVVHSADENLQASISARRYGWTCETLLIELTQIFRTVRRHNRTRPALIARTPTILRAMPRHIEAAFGLRTSLPYHHTCVDRVRVRA